MSGFEIFTICGLLITSFIGGYNLIINIKTQRRNQRELLFSKQFEFYIQLGSLVAQMEEAVFDMNTSQSQLHKIQERIFKLSNEIDLLTTKNEIIIPDKLFTVINEFSKYCHELTSLCYDKPLAFDKTKKNEFISKTVDLVEDIRDYLGVDKLSEENRKFSSSRI